MIGMTNFGHGSSRCKKRNNPRQVHLDFHRPHWVENVGAEYDPEELVQTWKDANVNAVTVVFGLCTWGNAYYDSAIAPVHPGLHKDMLTPLLPAAKRIVVGFFM